MTESAGVKEKIIIVEDDPGVRYFLEEALKEDGYRPVAYPSFEDAQPNIGKDTGLVIMDIKLPGLDGLSAIEEVKKRTGAPIVIITAYGTRKNAMKAIERGAQDFFEKPIALDELKIVLKRALATKQLRKEIVEQKERDISQNMFHGVVGSSEPMRDIFRQAERVAGKDFTVLITGETGTGKEEIAKLIHLLSRRTGELVIVNCASIPDNLLESDLFGHEKGAYTGAHQQKPGRFEVADNGTIVLDEIGEMSPYLQAKLLRVIETKEVERLGDVRKRKVNVRILATTNRDLEKEIKGGGFREDLYYRIAQIHITMPPLRQRKEDIPHLIDCFLSNVTKETGQICALDTSAKNILYNYEWPGNVRELLNVVKWASAMCQHGLITDDDLPLYMIKKGGIQPPYTPGSESSLDEAMNEFEKHLIIEALKKAKGSQVKAAKALGISERSMWYRVKKHDIRVDE